MSELEVACDVIPALVSGREAADLLGVSRQRVHQLVAQHPDFPAPVAKLACGSIWLLADVEAFARTWSRKPGRPTKASLAGRGQEVD